MYAIRSYYEFRHGGRGQEYHHADDVAQDDGDGGDEGYFSFGLDGFSHGILLVKGRSLIVENPRRDNSNARGLRPGAGTQKRSPLAKGIIFVFNGQVVDGRRARETSCAETALQGEDSYNFV